MKKIVSVMLVCMMLLGTLHTENLLAEEVETNASVEMELGQAYEVSLDEEETAYYSFTPETDGRYRFKSEGNYDVYAYLFDENGEEIGNNDDGGSNGNFGFSVELKAGSTYVLKVRSYESDSVFSISVEEKELVTLDDILQLEYQPYHYGYAGDTVVLKVDAASEQGELRYQWYDENEELIEGATGAEYSAIVEAESITPDEDSDTSNSGGAYCCKITDGVNEKTAWFYIQRGDADEKKVKKISLKSNYYQTLFFYDSGDNYVGNPGNILAEYEDGSSEEIYFWDCKEWDSIQSDDDGEWLAGEYKRYVYYKGAILSYDIMVVREHQIEDISLDNEVTDQIPAGSSEYRFYRFDIPSSKLFIWGFQFSEVKGNGQCQLYDEYGWSEPSETFSGDTCCRFTFYTSAKQIMVVNAADSAGVSYKMKLTCDVWDSMELEQEILPNEGNYFYYQYTPEQSGMYQFDYVDENEERAYWYDVKTSSGDVIGHDYIQLKQNPNSVYLKGGNTYYFSIDTWTSADIDLKLALKAVKYVELSDFVEKGGMCEDNLIWHMDEAGRLSIQSLDGKMPEAPWVFYGYPWTNFKYEIKEIKLEEGIEEIASHAFENTFNLETIQLPESIRQIGDYAFWNCDVLTSVDISSKVTDIGQGAFGECENLENINFTGENNLTYIGKDAFSRTKWWEQQGDVIILKDILLKYQSEEKNVVIPQTVSYVGEAALQNMPMESVTFRPALKGIWGEGFRDCTNLKQITVPGTVMEVAYSAFSGCTALENVVLEEGIQSLGASAFSDCSSMKDITVPNSVTEIDNNAIGYEWDTKNEEWIKLTDMPKIHCYENSVAYQYAVENGIPFEIIKGGASDTPPDNPTDTPPDIPSDIPSDNPTDNPTDIPSVILPTVAAVGTKITALEVEGSVGMVPLASTFTVVSNDANNPAVTFDGVTDENADAVEIPSQIIYGGVTYKVAGVSVTEFTKTIGKAVYNVTGNSIENLTVEFVKTTETKKKTIVVPEYVTYKGIKFKVNSVKEKAFKNNKRITTVKISSGITEIGANAFDGCRLLKNVIIGKDVQTIGKNAFKNCKKLKRITIKATGLKSVGKGALKGIYARCKIKVPASKVKSYTKLFKGKGQKSTVKIKK